MLVTDVEDQMCESQDLDVGDNQIWLKRSYCLIDTETDRVGLVVTQVHLMKTMSSSHPNSGSPDLNKTIY